jgi:hypothetical protein
MVERCRRVGLLSCLAHLQEDRPIPDRRLTCCCEEQAAPFRCQVHLIGIFQTYQ